MSKHRIQLAWQRGERGFAYDQYSRDHAIIYGNDSQVCASAAPEFHGNPSCLNPEQSFVASLASCHMLTFLALASKKHFTVDSYGDAASGVLGRTPERKPALTHVELHPHVVFSGQKVPSREQYEQLHQRAHELCFISNSVASCVEVTVSPEMETV
jgi:organic hydroperoxide reductase OsmC/OhrA